MYSPNGASNKTFNLFHILYSFLFCSFSYSIVAFQESDSVSTLEDLSKGGDSKIGVEGIMNKSVNGAHVYVMDSSNGGDKCGKKYKQVC